MRGIDASHGDVAFRNLFAGSVVEELKVVADRFFAFQLRMKTYADGCTNRYGPYEFRECLYVRHPGLVFSEHCHPVHTRGAVELLFCPFDEPEIVRVKNYSGTI